MTLESDIETAIVACDGPGIAGDYHDRHGTPSLCVLTVRTQLEAQIPVSCWVDEIRGKTVVEIGAGVGLLSLEMAKHARRVFAIEVDPSWSWLFVKHQYESKPANLTWILGLAETVSEFIRADVAVIRSYSGLRQMIAVAEQMAPRLILDFEQGWQVLNRGDTLLTKISRDVDAMVPAKITALTT